MNISERPDKMNDIPFTAEAFYEQTQVRLDTMNCRSLLIKIEQRCKTGVTLIQFEARVPCTPEDISDASLKEVQRLLEERGFTVRITYDTEPEDYENIRYIVVSWADGNKKHKGEE